MRQNNIFVLIYIVRLMRVDRDPKERTENLFNELGISMTEAVIMFLKQCDLNNGLPFDLKIPNTQTRKVLEDAAQGIDVHKCDSLDEMLRELNAD